MTAILLETPVPGYRLHGHVRILIDFLHGGYGKWVGEADCKKFYSSLRRDDSQTINYQGLLLLNEFPEIGNVLYSPHYKFLFVHIPKTGGTSLRAALKSVLYKDPWYYLMWYPQRLSHWTGHRTVTKFPRHAKIIAAKEMLPPQIFDQLFKFSVVRNPWDMQVSSFHHLHKEHPESVHGLTDFKDFIRYKMDPGRAPDPHLDVSATTQMDFLTDMHGNVLIDDFIRFEHLEEDYRRIAEKVGLKHPPALPHKRKGKRKKDFRVYYDEETRELVAERYRADIEQFGYRFEPEDS